MSCQRLALLIVCLLLTTETIGAQFKVPRVSATVDPVPAVRLIFGGTWQGQVGVEGGIPSGSWTQCSNAACVTAGNTTATAAQIDSAISGASDFQYVLLASGTYTASTNITVGNSYTELRGATDGNGLPATTINFTGGCCDLLELGTGSGLDFGNTATFTNINVTAPATSSLRGTTTVTLASTATGMTIGQFILFAATEGGDDFYGFGSSGAGQTWTHWARVSAISGTGASTQVTFSPAISADYLAGTVIVHYKAGGGFTKQVGLRNIKITQSAASNDVGFYGCDECWIYNSDLGQTSGSVQHVNIYGCFRCQIERTVFHDQATYDNSAYAIKAYWAGGLLVLNNYFHDFANIMPMFNVHGSVFAYNYVNALGYTSDPGWLSQILYDHGAQQDYNLYEGNWVASSHNDDSSTARNTIFFRNRMRCYDSSASTGATTNNANCLTQEQGYSYRTMACNVMGDDALPHTTYLNTFSGIGDVPAGGSGRIFNLNTDASALVLKYANYNTVDDAIHSGEGLSAGQACVTSYLFSAKPSWWGASQPWPMVDSANFSQSNTRTNFPAGSFAANGVWP